MFYWFLGYNGTDELKLTFTDAANGKPKTDSDDLRRKVNDSKNN